MFSYFRRFFLVCFSILWFVDQGRACFQPTPYVGLRTHILKGIATRDGRPIEGLPVSLYKANDAGTLIGNISINRRTKLTETNTDKNGKFSFGKLTPGNYEIVILGGSGLVTLRVTNEKKNQSLIIDSFGVGCQSFAARPEPQGKPKS